MTSVVLFCRCSEQLSLEQRQDTCNVYRAPEKKVGLDRKCQRNQTWTVSSGTIAITNSHSATSAC
jgi:hypothetical protein